VTNPTKPRATKPPKTSTKPVKTAAKPATDIPILAFARMTEWSSWLAANHAISTGIWVKFGKKDSGIESITYAEAMEGALTWGWVDSQKLSFDASSWLLKFTPRKSKSIWSQINRDKAIALIERGEMAPPGLREVERAKADGRWDAAYASQSKATVPDDLAAALAENAIAAAFFATLKGSNRYAILFRIQTAKKPETRAERIAKFVEMLARHEVVRPG
jgi:uncharacterized protein YdeI (YjbR/CyaY-like superfamily)